jgi:hypothetical protein
MSRADEPVTVQLDYEPALPGTSGRRVPWVWLIIVPYAIVAAAALLAPLWAMLLDAPGAVLPASVTAGAMTVFGFVLVFTPVRVAQRRRVGRAAIWIPILLAGLLLGLLFTAAGIALCELFNWGDAIAVGVMVGGGAVWLGWSIALWMLTRTGEPASVVARLHRWVLGGSIAELLIAVPAHVIVRRRNECCAGMATGMAICVGVAVMIVAMGPSVVLLYLKRWKQITGR